MALVVEAQGPTTKEILPVKSELHPNAEVLLQVRPQVAVEGKHAFTITARLTDPGARLKDIIVREIPFLASMRSQLELYCLEGGAVPDDVSLHKLGYELPPVLSLRNCGTEVNIRVVGVPMAFSLRWHPQSTLTQLLQGVVTRMRPRRPDFMRMFIYRSQADLCDGVYRGVPSMRQQLPPSSSNAKQQQQEDKEENEPMQERWTNESKRFYLPIERCYVVQKIRPIAPQCALVDIGLVGHPAEPYTVPFYRSRNGEPHMLHLSCTGASTMEEIKTDVLQIEEKERQRVAEQAYAISGLHWHAYDDDDEELSPGGEKSVYYHATEGYMSFMPPEVSDAPTYISLEENYTVPHLSDVGIMPGSDVFVEFFDPVRGIWNSDVLDEIEEADRDATGMLTVRTIRETRVNVPVSVNSTFEHILTRMWCATGDIPQFCVLCTDSGRVLCEWETLKSTDTFTHSSVNCTRRPRCWKGESLTIPKPKLPFYRLDIDEPRQDQHMVLTKAIASMPVFQQQVGGKREDVRGEGGH